MTAPSPERPPDLSFLLNQASYALSAQLGAGLAELGISVRDYCVLQKASEEERTQNVVAELAALDKTTMVVTLDVLEKAGLAERKVSSTDRRARVVSVTPRGRVLLARARGIVDDILVDALGVLEARQRVVFVEALEVLTGGIWSTPSHTAPVRRKQLPRSALPAT